MTIIGIDLGTTNSVVTFLKNERPEVIVNNTGGRTTPSVVHMKENGEIVIGENAKAALISMPDHTVAEVKRIMGSDKKVTMGNKQYRAEEISAMVLKYMKQAAEDIIGGPVTEAVITVPAYFTDSQRKATQKAGELAGLKVERVINEPTAASIAYGLENMEKEQNILVYDLGGGTFDVSVVEMFEGILEVKASAGNNELGGMDFDNLIVAWAVEKIEQEHGINLLKDGTQAEQIRARSRIKEEAEKTKKSLSHQTSARLSLPFITVKNGNPISVDYELTRFDFERMIKELADSTLIEVDRALKDARLDINAIDEVLLIGGSTRIPYIQELVKKKFGKEPRKDINPDEAVAMGAAIQGGIKSGEISSQTGLMVTDVCPYSLGIDITREIGGQLVPGYYDVILPRNCTIPAKESKTYYTLTDNQEFVDVKVYQGEESTVDKNIYLGQVEVPGIPQGPAGQAIEVTFSYDVNGFFQVEALVKSTGKTYMKAMASQEGVMSDEQMAAAKQSLDDSWDKSELYQEVKAVMYRAEKVAEDSDELSQQKINHLLNQLKDALRYNDTNAVKRYEEELTDLLIELV